MRRAALAGCLVTLGVGLLPAVALAADAPTPAQTSPNLTNDDAIMVFGGALMDCLQSREGGQMIKSIGAAARKDIMEAAESTVHLFLFVKVRENWTDDPARYREMGLDFPKS